MTAQQWLHGEIAMSPTWRLHCSPKNIIIGPPLPIYHHPSHLHVLFSYIFIIISRGILQVSVQNPVPWQTIFGIPSKSRNWDKNQSRACLPKNSISRWGWRAHKHKQLWVVNSLKFDEALVSNIIKQILASYISKWFKTSVKGLLLDFIAFQTPSFWSWSTLITLNGALFAFWDSKQRYFGPCLSPIVEKLMGIH